MRRLTFWILILALILLAICVLWLLPRLLERAPPPERDLAKVEAGDDGAAPSGGIGGAAEPPAGTTAAGSEAPADPGAVAKAEPAADAAVPPEIAAGDAPGAIFGRVVDSAGLGVGGATVLAAHAPDFGAPIEEASWWIAHLPLDVADPAALGAEAPILRTTDAQGWFAFESFEPGRVRLAVRSPKTDPLDVGDLRLAAGASLALGDVRVAPASRISGRIFDPDDRPIQGATITRVDDFSGTATPHLLGSVGVQLAETDASGHFQTLPIGRGPWSIRVSAGFDTDSLPIARASVQEGFELEATLERSQGLVGRVRTSLRAPRELVVRARPYALAPASVSFACRADARTAVVAADHGFELEGLAPGTVYELRASERSRPFEVDSAWSPPVLAIAGGGPVGVAWEPDASLSFRAVEARTQARLAECQATLLGLDANQPLPLSVPDGDAGLSVIEGVRPLRAAPAFRLCLSKPGYSPADADVREIRPGYALAVGDLELTPLPAMRIRVLDAETGRPITGARVVPGASVAERDACTATDAAGEARIRAYAGASARVDVEAAGYAPARRFGPFGGGFSEPTVELRLLRGAAVTVRAVDATGAAIPGARIEHVEGDWSPNDAWRDRQPRKFLERPDPRDSRIADAEGAVRFEHLVPGRHAFRVQRYRRFLDGEWSQREVREGESGELVLVSEAPVTLRVRVHDQGTALAGAPVALLLPEDAPDPIEWIDGRTPLPPGLDARLDLGGAASFANLAPGTYVLAIGVGGQTVRAIREVSVREGSGPIEIDVARRAIAGTVSDPQGVAVAGAEIRLVAWNRRTRDRSASGLGQLGYLEESEVFAHGLEIAATTADAAGRYRILGLPAREAFVVVARWGDGWGGESAPLVLKTDDERPPADLLLAQAGSIEVRVATSGGILPCLVAAVSRELRTYPRVLRTVSGLSQRIGGLPPGTWDIVVDAGGLGTRRERVDVVAGETAVVDLALP